MMSAASLTAVSSMTSSADLTPSLHVEPAGSISCVLEHGVVVELAVDHSLRVVMAGGTASFATARQATSAILHPTARIIPIVDYDGSASTHDQQQFLVDEYRIMRFDSEAQTGQQFIPQDVANKSVFIRCPDSSVYLHINGMLIRQSTSGDVIVDARPRPISCSLAKKSIHVGSGCIDSAVGVTPLPRPYCRNFLLSRLHTAEEWRLRTVSKKINLPAYEYPQYNIAGRILGPHGMTVKQLEQETGCKIMVRGKGSMLNKEEEEASRGKQYSAHLEEELHVLLKCVDTAPRAAVKIQVAAEEIQKLLIPAPEGIDELLRKQLLPHCYPGTYFSIDISQSLLESYFEKNYKDSTGEEEVEGSSIGGTSITNTVEDDAKTEDEGNVSFLESVLKMLPDNSFDESSSPL